ncbi:MAG: AAA family ATPase [Candidatus Microsaccharimonas sp.]
MKLLILFGAPAVGKATIGRLVAAKTDFKLFHNHMVMDGIIELFGVGTASEDKLSKMIRSEVIKEAAKSGLNLIFTYMWNFGSEKGKNNITAYKEIYESKGGEVIFIELTASLETRVERAKTPERKKTKIHAPNAERVAYLDSVLDYNSPKPFYFKNYTHINTTNKTADDVANEIVSII